jgi:mRNA interferase MazF
MTSLQAGDIAWVVFDPVVGTEQGGRRPAIVLTDVGFNELYPRSVVCPITRNRDPWPTKVILPSGMRTIGAVLADQPQTLHREGRSFRFIEHAPDEVLAAVRSVVAAVLGLKG